MVSHLIRANMLHSISFHAGARYRLHGESPHEGWTSETDQVWTNNHMARYTGLSTPPLIAKLWQRFSFVFLTEHMGACMLKFFQSLVKGPHPTLPAHVHVATDSAPKRPRVNKNIDSRRKNITRQFESVWRTKGNVPQTLFPTQRVWKLFKERNELDLMLYDLVLKKNCSVS